MCVSVRLNSFRLEYYFPDGSITNTKSKRATVKRPEVNKFKFSSPCN